MKRRPMNLSINIPCEETNNNLSFDAFPSCPCLNKACNSQCQLRNEGELGAGISGTVSKVVHIKTGRTWAKKVLAKNATSREEIERLLREIEILKKCDSPYVISTHGAIYHQNKISIFLEFMDVGSLDAVLNVTNRVPERVLSRITRLVLRGLVYLHDHCGICHGDVKPANILLNSNAGVKLCDFGVSAAPGELDGGSVFGTLAYMAPEKLSNQKISGSERNQQGDIWSLGITILELATGCYPVPTTPKADAELTCILKKTDVFGRKRRDENRPRFRDSNLSIFSLIEYFKMYSLNLPPGLFSQFTYEFIGICLNKNPDLRNNYTNIIKHTFLYLDQFDENAGEHRVWLKYVRGYLEGNEMSIEENSF